MQGGSKDMGHGAAAAVYNSGPLSGHRVATWVQNQDQQLETGWQPVAEVCTPSQVPHVLVEILGKELLKRHAFFSLVATISGNAVPVTLLHPTLFADAGGWGEKALQTSVLSDSTTKVT